jgi:hypothetical protein
MTSPNLNLTLSKSQKAAKNVLDYSEFLMVFDRLANEANNTYFY